MDTYLYVQIIMVQRWDCEDSYLIIGYYIEDDEEIT